MTKQYQIMPWFDAVIKFNKDLTKSHSHGTKN